MTTLTNSRRPNSTVYQNGGLWNLKSTSRKAHFGSHWTKQTQIQNIPVRIGFRFFFFVYLFSQDKLLLLLLLMIHFVFYTSFVIRFLFYLCAIKSRWTCVVYLLVRDYPGLITFFFFILPLSQVVNFFSVKKMLYI